MGKDAKKLAEVREHVEVCPIGYWDGKIVMCRDTKTEDVIKWLAELRRLVEIDV